MVTLYGGAGPTWPQGPYPQQPQTLPNDAGRAVQQFLTAAEGHRVRICVLVADDGAVRLKVLCDDKLIAEVEGSRSLTLETQIGGAK